MPVVIATVWPRPEKRDEVRSVLRETVAAVHQEDGCELYALHEADDRFVFVEQWASAEALRAHSEGPALSRANARLDELTAKPSDFVVVEPVPAGDPRKGAVAP